MKSRWATALAPEDFGCERPRLASFDPGKLARRLGILSAEQYSKVKAALRDLLGL